MGWGILSVFSVASPSDLEQHLVDGCLRLQATVSSPLKAEKPPPLALPPVCGGGDGGDGGDVAWCALAAAVEGSAKPLMLEYRALLMSVWFE
jgi:hypothetical protein